MLTNHELLQLQYEARKRNAQIRYVQRNAATGEIGTATRYMTPGVASVTNTRLRKKGAGWVWMVDQAIDRIDLIEPEESTEQVELLLRLAQKTAHHPGALFEEAFAQSRNYNPRRYSLED